ncbi:MAG: amino acid adenylation domain-containing protein [Roseitalea sp.]|nr:amino acid adenylation domain-containing protein [Roseitalea sp.]MBO6720998.1 amino acid adenylation domain-containing protein [Roseitalea sp.]MBO6742930.1 amino acid adenylation domain-containing protein [Roseitalea sp.]
MSLFAEDDELTIDLRLSRRRMNGLEKAVGPMLEVIPVRFQAIAGATPADLLARNHVAQGDALAPFFDRKRFDGEPDRLPVGFTVARPISVTPPAGVAVHDLHVADHTERFDLDMRITPLDDRTDVTLLSTTVPEQELELLAEAVVQLVGKLRTSPDAPYRRSDLIGPRHRERLLDLSGVGATNKAEHATLVEAFDAAVNAFGDASAVASGATVLTFSQLKQRSGVLAAELVHQGIGMGDRVGVVNTRDCETIVALWAVWRAGGVVVALEPDYPQARLDMMLADAGLCAVAAAGHAADMAKRLFAGLPVIATDARSSGSDPAVPDRRLPTARSGAYIIYTSGSTGRPKGVLVSHGNCCHLAQALDRSVYGGSDAAMRISINASLCFDSSMKQVLAMLHGHCVCPVPADARGDVEALTAFVRTNDIDVFDCTPSLLRLLLDAGFKEGSHRPRRLLVGGEAIDSALWARLQALPGVRSFNMYGPTEATVNATFAAISGPEPAIGQPMPGSSVHILDEDLNLLPLGQTGEVFIGGDGVAQAYWGAAAETARRFLPDPFSEAPGARMYRTGDFARLRADGQLVFAGRHDRQVKVRGHRVEVAEVEATLRAHPQVAHAAVTVRRDEFGTRLFAHAEPVSGNGLQFFAGQTLCEFNRYETKYLYDEIFRDRTYIRAGIGLPDGAVVFDVGANIGMFSAFVALECRRPTIYAFEPLPPLFECLEANAAVIDAEVHLFNCGLSDRKRQEVFLLYGGYSVMSGQKEYQDPSSEIEVIKRYLTNQRGDGDDDAALLLGHADELLTQRFESSEHACALVPLSDIIEARQVASIDLLKIDVQRAELDVLKGVRDTHWPLIKQIAMEVHDGAGTPTEGRLDETIAFLESRGFLVTTQQDDLLRNTDRYNLFAHQRGVAAMTSTGRAKAPTTAWDGALTADDLSAYLAETLPDHMVPAALEVLPEIPLNANGKTDYRALAERPVIGGRKAEPAGKAATGAIGRSEAVLVDIWQTILGVDKVGVDDNFFDLGGDSIRSIRAQAEAGKHGISFTLRDLFAHQTIRALVENCVSGTEDQMPNTGPCAPERALDEPVPDGIDAIYPMSRLQTGMVYHTELTGQPGTYHNAVVYRLRAPLDGEALQQAVYDLCLAHPILRTAYDFVDGAEPLQIVHSEPHLRVEFADPPNRTSEAVARWLIDQELARPFDWQDALMLRLVAVAEDEGSFLLMVGEHHSVLDGMSMHLMLEELSVRYDAARRGLAAQLPAAPAISPQAAIAAERSAEADSETVAFWKMQLAAARPTLLVDTSIHDRAPPDRVARHEVDLPADISARVQKMVSGHDFSARHYFMAVHGAALSAATGQRHVTTGLVCNVRPEQEDGDRILGLFLNTVPFAMDCSGSLPERAQACFEAEMALLPHRFMPLASMVRDSSEIPFNTFFNFTHFAAGPTGDAARFERFMDIPVDIDFGLATDFELNDDGLRLYFQYDPGRFSAESIAALGRLYGALLDGDGEVAGLPAIAGLALETIGGAPGAVERTGDIESRVTEIWADTLGLNSVGPHVSFSDLGGNSMLTVRLLERMRTAFGPQLKLGALMANPTIRGQALLLGSLGAGTQEAAQ